MARDHAAPGCPRGDTAIGAHFDEVVQGAWASSIACSAMHTRVVAWGTPGSVNTGGVSVAVFYLGRCTK